MRENQIRMEMKGLHLRIFFPISLTIHSLFFLVTFLLLPDLKVNQIPVFEIKNIEVSMILPPIQVTSAPKVKLKEVNKNLFTMNHEPSEIIKEEKILPKIEMKEEVFHENQAKNESHLIAKEEREVIKNNDLKLTKVEIEEKPVFKEESNPLPLTIEPEVRNAPGSISPPFQAKDTKVPLIKKELESRVSSTTEMAEMKISNKPSEPLPLDEVKIAIKEPSPLSKGSNSNNEKESSPLKEKNIITGISNGTEKYKIINLPASIEVSKSLEDLKRFENDEGQDKQSQDSTFTNISTSKETTKMVKYSSNSERILPLTQPKYAYNPVPPYPQEARRKGYEGEVLLRVEVLSDGRVGQIEIRRSSGYKVLDHSAIDAVKKWRFTPGMKGEEAISFWVNIPIKFQLR